MNRILTLLLLSASFCLTNTATAEAQSSKGDLVLGVNTGFGGNTFYGNIPGNTGLYFFSDDESSLLAIGGDMSFFVVDDAAIKVGLGYVDFDDNFSTFAYKIGGIYYINGRFPIGVDVFGYTDDIDVSFIGLQGGYTIYLGDGVMLDPGIRYNITLDDEKANSFFQLNAGFSLLLN